MNEDYNNAIEYATSLDAPACRDFLIMWQEGDWEGIEKEFSDFEISTRLRYANTDPIPMSEVPQKTLVLCNQGMTGVCLRYFDGDNAYDEHENFDDSDLPFYGWWPIPEEIQ